MSRIRTFIKRQGCELEFLQLGGETAPGLAGADFHRWMQSGLCAAEKMKRCGCPSMKRVNLFLHAHLKKMIRRAKRSIDGLLRIRTAGSMASSLGLRSSIWKARTSQSTSQTMRCCSNTAARPITAIAGKRRTPPSFLSCELWQNSGKLVSQRLLASRVGPRTRIRASGLKSQAFTRLQSWEGSWHGTSPILRKSLQRFVGTTAPPSRPPLFTPKPAFTKAINND